MSISHLMLIISRGDVASSDYATTGNKCQNYDLRDFVWLAMVRKR